MTTDSETTEQYLTFVRSRFLISVLVIRITADKNHIIFASPATRLTYLVQVATVILQNKHRFLGEKSRNPDETKKPRSSGKNPAVVIVFRFRRSRPQSHTGLILLGLVFEVSCVCLWVSCVYLGRCRFVLSVPWPSDWLQRLVSEMTCYVSSGTLNSTNSTHSFCVCFS